MAIERILLASYAGLLKLYPPDFQRDFGDEMRSVFSEALCDSRQRGVAATLRIIGRELAHLPGSLLLAYRQVGWEREAEMDQGRAGISSGMTPEGSPTGWGDAFLAALPFVVILVLDGLLTLLVDSGMLAWEATGMRVFNITMIIILTGILLLALVRTVRHRWPLWSASWYLFFCLPVLVALGWLLTRLIDGRVDDQDLFLFVILPLAIAVLLYWLVRLDRLRVLLAAMPVLYFLWLPNMEQTPNHIIPVPVEMLVKGVSTVLVSLAIVAILRLGNWRTGFWIILVANLAVGLQFSYVGIYHGGQLPFVAAGPSPAEVVKNFIPQYLAGGSILVGPLFAWRFRMMGQRSGAAGNLGYHLALLSLLGIILANLLGLMDGIGNGFGIGIGLTYQRLGWLIFAALGGYLAGLVLVYGAAWRSGLLPDVIEMVLLALLPMAIPVTFVLPFITWKWPVSPLYGVPALWEIPQIVSLAAGLVWLGLSIWLVTREARASAAPGALPQPG